MVPMTEENCAGGPVRVMVVDDRSPFRAAARAVIEMTDGFECVGEAESGEQAIELARELLPDLVLTDVNLSGIDGCETTRRLREERPSTVVFLLSTYESGDLPSTMASCGAATYIRKEALFPDLLEDLWRQYGPCHAT
jgi:two-component system invasion response regulator UvrY